jgi:hypothetical protein
MQSTPVLSDALLVNGCGCFKEYAVERIVHLILESVFNSLRKPHEILGILLIFVLFHYFVSPSLPLALFQSQERPPPLVGVEVDACHGSAVVQLDSALIGREVASHINAVTTAFNIVSIRFITTSGQWENHRYGHKHGN